MDIFKSKKIFVLPRKGDSILWGHTFEKAQYQPVLYTNSSIEYQLAYQRGHGGDWKDHSLIIFWDNKPSALWPLSISIKDNTPSLTSQGSPILPPIFVSNTPYNSRRQMIKACIDAAESISNELGIDSYQSGESFINSFGISDWHLESLVRGASCKIHYDLYLDLNQSMEEIRKNFRKSYKPLISSGLKMWSTGILKERDDSVWAEFKNLHLKVSGRVTRSNETWAMQLKEIENQNSFLIWLRNQSGTLIGGGLFNLTSNEGVYAVGAYDRSLFDKPLGHIVQSIAITEMKERGIHWYKIGARFFPSENPTPTEKEIKISEFKQGFASHIFPHFRITHHVRSESKL